MPKYVHRAKTLPAIPMDYVNRWVASDSASITLSGAEVTSWESFGGGTLGSFSAGSVTSGPTVGTVNGHTALVFNGTDEALRGGDQTAVPNYTDVTWVVAATAPTLGDGASYKYVAGMYSAVMWGSKDDTTANEILLRVIATNSYTSSSASWSTGDPVVFACTYDGDGTATSRPVTSWVGKDKIYNDSPAAITGQGLFSLSGNFSGTFLADTAVFEILMYDRVLSDAEMGKVVDYLSNKYSAANGQASTDGPTTASTAETWTNNTLDPEGEGVLTHPGKQPGEYSIVRLGDRDAPRVSGNSRFDDNYPMTTWGSSVKYYFDAADTGNMTFATGSASAGGTVSSWTDKTGSVTMNTTASGDSAVDFNHKVKGRPTISGGTSGTPKSLEATASVTYSTTAGHERLFWAVIDMPDDTSYQAPCSWVGAVLFPSSDGGVHNGDLYPGENVPAVYMGPGTGPVPVTSKNTGRTHVILAKVVQGTGVTADVTAWYCGLKGPTKTTTNAGANGKCAVGALDNSFYDSPGNVWEFGAIDSAATGITDSQVEDLARHLCEKYDVDYMPDTTPLDIGLHARSTSGSIAQTDLCLWYRSDKNLSETAWGLHPLCAQLHTTPSNFVMTEYTAGGALAAEGGRRNISFSEAAGEGLVQANTYASTETTDFPADTNGMSGFHLCYHDPATTTSYGSFQHSYVGNTRFTTTSDTSIRHTPEGGSYVDWTGSVGVDKWALFGTVYHYDSDGSGGIGEAGTPDGDPHTWYLCNDETVKDDDAAAATSFIEKCSVGCNSAGANEGVSRSREIVVFKHPLVEHEISNLKRYLNYRYNLGLTP